MSEKKVKEFTLSQKKAIEHKGGNLVLSAAAGSGKTATLTEKIIRLVSETDGIDISRMLIVTFTKAAAGELKARISDALMKKMAEMPTKHLMRQMSRLDSAQISTIHSFLKKEVSEHFSEFGLPPDFEILDDSEAEILKNDAMGETISYFLSLPETDSRRKGFEKLGILLSSAKNEESASGAFRENIEKFISLGTDAEILRARGRDIATCDDVMKCSYGDLIKKEVGEFAGYYAEQLSEIDGKLTTEKLLPLREECGKLLSLCKALTSGKELCFAEIKDLIEPFGVFPRIPSSVRQKADNSNAEEYETYKKYKDCRDGFKNGILGLIPIFTEDDDSVRFAARETGELLLSFADVMEHYTALFSEKKRERGRADYNDLERFSLKLFVGEDGLPTDAAKETGKKFDIIFVDEYQDTNTVQDKIFKAIGSASRRFMVGDVKQSIYGFRGAMPEVFTSYRERYEKEDGGEAVFLSENFRSDKSVIDFANMVSAYMFSFGNTPFKKEDKLICAKTDGDKNNTPVEVCYLSSDKKRTDEKTGVSGAEYVAERVAKMLLETEEVGGEIKRKYRPSDIAVLFRSSTGMEEYAEAFDKRNIPYNDSMFGGTFSSGEMLLMICFLKCAENPLRDIYLAGAMKSPLIGFTLDDLVNIRREKDIPLWYSLISYCETGKNTSLREKCLSFVKTVERWRQISGEVLADETVRQLLTDTGMATWCGDGVRTRKDIRRSVKKIMEISASVSKIGGGLHELVERIDMMTENDRGGDYIPDDGKVVFLNIHKSKGLEFPVCIVPKCDALFNTQDERGVLLFDKQGNVGIKLNSGNLVKCDNALRLAVRTSMYRNSTEEYARLLYVAMTRARERLILTSSVSDIEKKKAKFDEGGVFDSYTASKVKSFEGWLFGAISKFGAHPSYRIVYEEECDTTVLPDEMTYDEKENDAVGDVGAIGEYFSKEEINYENGHLSLIPAKLTVSVLAPDVLNRAGDSVVRFFDAPELIKLPKERSVPQFLSEEKKTGAEKGTATHIFMQFCDFDNLYSCGAEAELERLTKRGFISKENAALVRLSEIELFRKSEIFKRMLHAKEIFREQRFNAMLPAEKFTTDDILKEKLKRDKTMITVQGVVDCIFTDENGKTVLIDYKTDRLTKEEKGNSALAENKLLERHTAQLVMYRDVCADMLGREFDEVYIYSLPLGRTVEVKKDK